jgi:hypothetical protein
MTLLLQPFDVFSGKEPDAMPPERQILVPEVVLLLDLTLRRSRPTSSQSRSHSVSKASQHPRVLATLGSVAEIRSPVWDAYLLYGPETTWRGDLSRPISSGYTVYGAREELEKNIVPLLE